MYLTLLYCIKEVVCRLYEMLYPCICNVVISCWKCGAYDFVICCGWTDMCFVPGSGWKHLDLEQYRVSVLTPLHDTLCHHKPPFIFSQNSHHTYLSRHFLAFPRYIAMQHPPYHDLIFMPYMFLLHWQRNTFAHIMIATYYLCSVPCKV